MDKLVLCGKFRSESPVGDDTCNSQSALDFITCSNNKTQDNDNKGKSNSKSNLNKICKNSSFAVKNGQQPNHYVDLDVGTSEERNKTNNKGNPQTNDKTKAKQDEPTCFAAFFEEDYDDDVCNNYHDDKENTYQHLNSNNVDETNDQKATSCVNKKKRKDESDHESSRRDVSKKELQGLPWETLDSEERICYVQNLNERFSIVRKIGSGTFGSVFLAIRLRDQRKVALKKLPKDRTKIEDFCLEFRHGRQFSRHPCILETSPVAYITKSWYVLVQEYAPMSDLLRSVPPRLGLPEIAVKSVARQLAGGVEYIHSKQVVHRDLKLENILIFQDQGDIMLTRVKLGDFGVARKVGTMVCKVCDGTTYTPPEICSLGRHSYYRVERSADVWSLGVVIFCLMTGSFPWQLADLNVDPLFQSFARWQCRRTPLVPEHWLKFTPTLRSLFHRYLEMRSIKRAEVSILTEYLDAPWSTTGPPLEQSASTNASGIVSTCNALGSASTLTCASPNQQQIFTSSTCSSSTCHHHNHHHYHQLNDESLTSTLKNNLPSCQWHDGSFNTGSSSNAANPHISSAMFDGVYKNSPLKTSGALYSPLLDDDVYKQSDIFCGSRRNQIENSHRPMHRCNHQHHGNMCDMKDEHKSREIHKRLRVPNGLCEDRSLRGDKETDKTKDLCSFDPETKFRLERVNRWIMNQMT